MNDESLFLHDFNDNQVWVLRLVEKDTRQMRFNIINTQNDENIKIFVLNNIEAGILILSDNWSGYNFIVDEESMWEHETHTHGMIDLGFGDHSSSNIETTLVHINKITFIYNMIAAINFIYYFLEVEFWLSISKKITNKNRNFQTNS